MKKRNECKRRSESKNRNIATYTSLVSVVSQCKPVSGCRLRKLKSTPFYGPFILHTSLTSFVLWQMSRLVSNYVPVRFHHWSSTAPGCLLSSTELFWSPLLVFQLWNSLPHLRPSVTAFRSCLKTRFLLYLLSHPLVFTVPMQWHFVSLDAIITHPTFFIYILINDVTDCWVACERETDIAILMDSSANIGMSKFMTLKSVAANVIELLSIETGDVRVAVVTYAQNADVNVYLGRWAYPRINWWRRRRPIVFTKATVCRPTTGNPTASE